MRLIQPVAVALTAPLLLFPRGPLPWVGLLLVLGSWILVRATTGRGIVRTALDRPILVILLMAVVSLYPSVDLALSLPKFYGILLGVSVYYATVRSVSRERHFWIGVWLLLACTFAVSVLGLFGTQWSDGKSPWLIGIYGVIPQIVTEVESSVGVSSGIHPNQLGGTLAFLLPLPIALLLASSLSYWLRAAIACMVALSLGVMVLSASRSAIIGLAASFFVLVTWRSRFAGLALLALGAAAFDVVLLLEPSLLERLFSIDASGVPASSASYFFRREIWDHARYMIEDFPFTGIGINTFDIVLATLYPLFPSSASVQLVHAHNIFLQTAVDLGLGGLMGFLGLWATLAYVGCKAVRRVQAIRPTGSQRSLIAAGRSPLGTAVVGLLLGMLSFLVYGLTDAITLGAKPMVLLWLMAGLIVAAERISRHKGVSTNLQPLGDEPSSVRHNRQLDLAVGLSPVGTVFTSTVGTGERPGQLIWGSDSTDCYPASKGLELGGPNIRSIRCQNPLTVGPAEPGLRSPPPDPRPLALVLAGAREAYWITAFLLVGMGYLVVFMGIMR